MAIHGLKTARKLHRTLLWMAIMALMLFVVSAITHPLMVWTGPKAEMFFPPNMQLNGEQTRQVASVLKKYTIQHALIVKVLPSELGAVLQVTQSDKKPRRYFLLSGQQELLDYDVQHAKWLARYYLGGQVNNVDISSVEFITEFSAEYSWVNQLLPVYKVSFANDKNLKAYVYTETNALADIDNDWKRINRTIFQWFHTYSWLDDYPVLRITLITVLLGTLMIMLVSGFILLVKIRRKKPVNISTSTQLHRKLAWFLVLPFLGFLFSAFYHLYQSEFGTNYRGMRLGKVMQLSDVAISSELEYPQLNNQSLNALSLIEYKSKFFYRASIAQDKPSVNHDEHAHHGSMNKPNSMPQVSNQQRFDGLGSECGVFYLATDTGASVAINDQELAETLAARFFDFPLDKVLSSEQVTHFGPDYDFRNKRLPVWRVTLDTPQGDRVFVDTTSGILVDRVVDVQRYEGYSFSFLHKWNFLVPLMGRESRDVVIVFFLLLLVSLGGLGVVMRKVRHG